MARKKSFTLIEMLIVMSIIILLIGIVLLVFSRGDYQKKANDTQRKKDIQELSNAIEEFKADHGHYPLVNWGGINKPRTKWHAWEALNGSGLYSGYTDSCDNASYNNYTAYQATRADFDPGTNLKFNTAGKACDDLSIQLLGYAYLPKMPYDNPTTISIEDPGADPWQVISPANAKPYIDEIPQDPVGGSYNVGLSCGGGYYPPDKNADYDTTLGGNCLQVYRYFYNSYYQCSAEGINVGDRYWMNTIMQLQANGELDNLAHGSFTSGTGAFFYEWGTANFFRYPRSQCF